MEIGTVELQNAKDSETYQAGMDQVEREIQKVLHRVHPTLGEVVIIVDAFRGRVYVEAREKVWFFRPRKGWLARLYRAAHCQDIRGLSEIVYAYFRQDAIHAEISQWISDHISRQQQSTAPDTAGARI